MNQRLLKKAVALTVVPRRDGSYHVSGSSGNIYTVRFIDEAAYCDCTAGGFGNDCSHKLAATHYSANQKEQPSV